MSALVNELGSIGIPTDPVRIGGNTPGFSSTAIMDATGEKIAILGCVWHPTVKTGTINIRKIHFRVGEVTLNEAADLSAIQVSLQNVSATAGPPYQPDGTADQTVTISGVNPLPDNTWITTGNLSADRVVDLSATSIGSTNSRWLAVVWEYTTFTALDSVVISASTGSADFRGLLGSATLLNTGSWAALTTSGIVALECDDGTFAFLRGCMPISAYGSVSVSSTGAIRRAGVKFKYPTQRKISAATMMVNIANGCDGRFVLYDSDGTTELVSVDVDNDAIVAAGSPFFADVDFEPVTLAADTYYRWVFVGSTATAATVYYADVNAAGLMDGLILGQNAHWTQADSTPTWTDTTTRRPHFGFGVSAIHDGTGGGGLLRANMSGGVL